MSVIIDSRASPICGSRTTVVSSAVYLKYGRIKLSKALEFGLHTKQNHLFSQVSVMNQQRSVDKQVCKSFKFKNSIGRKTKSLCHYIPNVWILHAKSDVNAVGSIALLFCDKGIINIVLTAQPI